MGEFFTVETQQRKRRVSVQILTPQG